MNDEPKILIPYDWRESIALRGAAKIAGRSESTVRSWCQDYHIGRRVGGGPWQVSRPALMMFLDDDKPALRAYLSGDRESELVRAYFRRSGIGAPQQNPQLQQKAQEAR